MTTVRVVVTTKNNETIIRECLDHIYNQDFQGLICCVADDGSTDGTLDIIKKEYPRARLYNCNEAKGPSYNRNVVLADTNEDFVVFMDSDAFIEKDWISNAVARMEKDDKIGLIGGKVYDGRTKRIQSVGGKFHSGGICWLVGCEESDDLAKIDEKYYFHLPSSTFMLRTHVAKKVGGFDADYCYLYEDLDICWRVWLAGYTVLYYRNLVSRHLLSTTSKNEYTLWKRQYMSKRNKMISIFKNFELFSLTKYMIMIIVVSALELILLKPRGAVFWGNMYPLLHPLIILKKRKEVEAVRRVCDKEIAPLITSDHLSVIKMCLGDVIRRRK